MQVSMSQATKPELRAVPITELAEGSNYSQVSVSGGEVTKSYSSKVR